MVADDEFLEWAHVFGHRYGTPRAQVEAMLAAGKDVLFDIDWQGAQQLFQIAGGDVVRVFIFPPSMEELRARLTNRNTDSAEVIDARMARAANEVSHWDGYDYVLVNDDVEECFRGVEDDPGGGTPEALAPDRADRLHPQADAGRGEALRGGGPFSVPSFRAGGNP